jgi:hypothetical protein
MSNAFTVGAGTSNVPPVTTLTLNGVTVTIEYVENWGTSLAAKVIIPISGMGHITTDDIESVIDPRTHHYSRDYVFAEDVLDRQYVPTYGSLAEMQREARRREALAVAESVEDQLAERLRSLHELHEEFVKRTGYRDTDIEESFRPARTAWGWEKQETIEECIGRVNRVERLIKAVLARPFHVVLAEHYAKGWRNRDTLSQLLNWSIRSGGFIEMPDLVAVYSGRLDGVMTMDEARSRDLTIKLEDYAPADVVKDLDLAPTSVEITQRNRTKRSCWVTYALEREGETYAPTGTVTMSLNEYKLNKPVSEGDVLSSLPYGIRLVVAITVNEKEVFRGTPGEALDKKIKSYEGGKRRGSSAPPVDFRHGAVPVGEIPPWCVSAGAGRWR